MENSKTLFEFAFNNKILSKTALYYIESHTTTDSKYNSLSTVKKPDCVYQARRMDISNTLLQEIESEPSCKASIEMMGHKIYESLANANNMSISLYVIQD